MIRWLVEAFVLAELRRQLTWAATDVAMFHWQDRSGAEGGRVLRASAVGAMPLFGEGDGQDV
jgi:hypothetical protein